MIKIEMHLVCDTAKCQVTGSFKGLTEAEARWEARSGGWVIDTSYGGLTRCWCPECAKQLHR